MSNMMPTRPAQRRAGRRPWPLLALLGLAPMMATQADPFADLQLSVQRDDNATRAFLDSDTYADTSADLTLSGGQFFQLQASRTATVFGSLNATRFADLPGLHSNAITLGGSLTQKFGLGAYAPAVAARLSWTHHDSHSQTRDRELLSLELDYSKRLTPAWAVSVGTVLDASQGRHDARRHASLFSTRNDIFDFNQAGLQASAEYTFANYATLTAAYRWTDGHTVSSALAPNPALRELSRALTVDKAVRPPPGRTQVAYALPTKTQEFSLDYSLPFGRNSAVNVGVGRQLIKADGGVDYRNTRLRLSLVHILR